MKVKIEIDSLSLMIDVVSARRLGYFLGYSSARHDADTLGFCDTEEDGLLYSNREPRLKLYVDEGQFDGCCVDWKDDRWVFSKEKMYSPVEVVVLTPLLRLFLEDKGIRLIRKDKECYIGHKKTQRQQFTWVIDTLKSLKGQRFNCNQYEVEFV